MLDFRDGARGGTCSSQSLSLPAGDGSPTKAKFNWLFLAYARGSFQVLNLYKKRPFTKIKCLVYIFQEWCSRGDLNPHAISIRPSSVRVYQFHHPSRCFIILKKHGASSRALRLSAADGSLRFRNAIQGISHLLSQTVQILALSPLILLVNQRGYYWYYSR